MIHGCPNDKEKALDPEKRTYDKHWMPWLKKELVSRGIEVKAPLMPEPWYPNYENFKQEFEKHDVTEDTILIGHSCGCAFLVRWLGESKQKIKKLILVAPWKIPHREDGSDVDFYTYDIDTSIKDRVDQIAMFTSDNEADDGKKSLKIFHDALGGKVIDLPDHGHYIFRQMQTEEFPELLNVILEQ